MTTYVWKNRFHKADPKTVATFLRREAQKRGKDFAQITPDEVIEVSRNPKAPTHVEFEWDDAKAAHEHRRDQARGILADIVIVNASSDVEESQSPLFVHVNTEDGPRYVPTEHVLKNDDLRSSAVEQVARLAAALARKLEMFEDIFGSGIVHSARALASEIQERGAMAASAAE